MKLLELLQIPSFQTLHELQMNQKTYDQYVMNRSDVHVGFEFELSVNPDVFTEQLKQDIPTEKVSRLDLDDIDQYFTVSRRMGLDAEDAFTDHIYQPQVEELAQEFVNQHWNEYLEDDETEEDNEDEARDRAYEYFIDNEAPDKSDVFTDYKVDDIIDEIGAEPVYGYTDAFKDEIYTEDPEQAVPDDGELDEYAVQFVEEELSNRRIEFAEVKNDSSVENIGVEIVTEPLPIEEALENADEILDWIGRSEKINQVFIDDSAGLHINISISQMDEIDPLKLAVFLGDEYTLKVFNRIQNAYSTSQIRKLVSIIKNENADEIKSLIGKDNDKVINYIGSLLDHQSKHMSINLSKMRDGYIEFRTAGGGNYHYRTKTIFETVQRFATAMVVASDKQLYRKEYLKKLSKLISRDDPRNPPTAPDLPPVLSKLDQKLGGQITRHYKPISSQDNSTAGSIVVNFFLMIHEQINKHNMRLGVQDVQFLRRIYQQHQTEVDQNLQQLQSENPGRYDSIFNLLRLNTQKSQPSTQSS